MRASTTLALAFAACASAAVKPSADLTAPSAGKILPGAYIVQFTPGHVSIARVLRSKAPHDLTRSQDSVDAFYSNLTANGISAVHRQTFQPNVFSGTSFHLTSNGKTDMDKIGNFTQVKQISPVRLFSTAAPSARRLNSVNWSKVGKRNLRKRLETLSNDTISTHRMA